MTNFNEYLIMDGEHAVSAEAKQYEAETGKPFAFGTDSVHKVYKFPNGYGASVIKGWFSNDMWEIIVVGFKDASSDDYEIVGDYLRFVEFEDVESMLGIIQSYEQNELEYIEELKRNEEND